MVIRVRISEDCPHYNRTIANKLGAINIEPNWHGKSPEYYEDDFNEDVYEANEEMKRDYQADMEETYND